MTNSTPAAAAPWPSYHRPATLDAALELLAEAPMTVAAGCTDLFPATGARALPGAVLDITAIAALKGIACGPEGVRIGATTTWSEIARADLPPAFDMLREAAREVGSQQIQNAATLAGNLCNASPAADGVPCLLALDATVELVSRAGVRRLPLGAFISGPRQTLRRPDELVSAIHVPASALGGRSRFCKLGARRYLVISIAMVAARLEVAGERVARAAIAVGACGPVAVRLSELEAALAGAALAEIGARVDPALVAASLSPIDDIRADAGYRRAAAVELVRRALADLAAAQEVVS
ncbi:MAG: xanthine dehydrogenase family protein subunit M [Roseovarius sp.]